MSDQGALSDGRENDFGLIETLLWTRDEGFGLVAEHLARLAASSAALGFADDEARVRDALNAAVAVTSNGRLRVRLVLARDGTIETSVTPIEPIPPDAVWRVAVAKRRFSSADPLLRHKTTRRALYEDALGEAAQRYGADEVLFQNERDELCEAARCNLFAPEGETLLTPPLSCGLLPGTLRAALIAQGRARESILRLEDISRSEFFLGNSVRGLVRARLVD
ncbi:aminotransferase class IV [Methylocystis sp. H62]|uniref:aminotransferase class IV n=1 Tax=Methylocystis sp. H62 TaxID=2785789 RepID=UPI0018C1F2E4|nr:aminotransferase class IV [Methylocystis sp. H62]MBG0794146.1 aminotransferase class IV [Methylocystis sp. H62]